MSNQTISFPPVSSKDDPRFPNYLAAYCINPPNIPGECPFPGRCPNPDAAGILVRVAAYVTTLCLGILLLYSPPKARGSFWSLMLYVYSLLLTTLISISNRGITRFHSEITLQLAGSPLILWLCVHSIMGLIGRKHRLQDIFSRDWKNLPATFVILGAFILWIVILGWSESGDHLGRFLQPACDLRSGMGKAEPIITIIPYSAIVILIWKTTDSGMHWRNFPTAKLLELLPIPILLIVWISCAVRSRHQIKSYNPERSFVRNMWVYMKHRYTFLHFLLVWMLPWVYYVLVIEDRLFYSGSNDNHADGSFGQLGNVRPLVQALTLLPEMWIWFKELSWVGHLAGRGGRSDSKPSQGEEELPIVEKPASTLTPHNSDTLHPSNV
ncbi:hypothetical protein DL96DRAFT_1619102 [Flagelloscypha sp. PMI_526]|nr:hypothetical protein DL96DRAFT_1619102 [Flagelloscypha sp. PMI_526]